MGIQIKEISYENYGKCVHITNGIIEVIVTIEVGPRIVRFGFKDGVNMMYNDLERKHKLCGEEFEALYGKGNSYNNYGGHRLWLSPESLPATYYPDNNAVVYSLLNNGVKFTPPRQKHNQMQLSFEVMMNEGANDIMVVHSGKNHSRDTQILALWAITALNPGGLVIIPQNHGGEELEPNRSVILWPYTRLRDPRVFWGEKFITVRHDPSITDQFKIGCNNLVGWACYVNNGIALIKRFVHNNHAVYPDFGASFETYLNKDYAELETLSPLYHVKPGETIRHVENLTLCKIHTEPNPADEAQLEKFIEKL